MTLEITIEETGIKRKHPNCPDCKKKASKIWISHDHQWLPCGVLCKHCGFVQVYGIPDKEKKANTGKEEGQ